MALPAGSCAYVGSRPTRSIGSTASSAGPDPAADRGWFVNSEGQTLTIVRGPAPVPNGRSFAVATREVTLAEYRRFLRDQPDPAPPLDDPEFRRLIRSDNAPVVGVSWFDAALLQLAEPSRRHPRISMVLSDADPRGDALIPAPRPLGLSPADRGRMGARLPRRRRDQPTLRRRLGLGGRLRLVLAERRGPAPSGRLEAAQRPRTLRRPGQRGRMDARSLPDVSGPA